MSLSELKALLLTIRDNLSVLSSMSLPWWIRIPSELRLGDGVYFSRDGCVHVRRGRRVVRYTVEKFFIHQARKLSREEILEAVERLRDLVLLVKLEKGTLTARDVLRCRNAIIRQFLLERLGYERFIEELGCRVIHRDGESELIMVPMRKDEEPIFLVKVRDPSTGRLHLLRVPPSVRTCREAIAWTFGLEAHEYNPIKET